MFPPYREGHKASGGFTLLEMLIAIGVIILIAALLLPSFKTARDKAAQVKDIGNLRSLGMAFEGYVGENGGVFPFYPAYGGFRGSSYVWQLLTPYLDGDMDVFKCPLDKRAFHKAEGVQFLPNIDSQMQEKMLDTRCSYASNDWITGGYYLLTDLYPGVPGVGSRLAVTTPASQLVLFFESATPDPAWMSVARSNGAQGFNSDYPCPDKRHADGSIIYFLDGHAQWFPIGKAPKTWEYDFDNITFNPRKDLLQ